MTIPITITNNSPAVSITTANSSLSYEQVLFTLNQTSYKVNSIDIQANSFSQLSEPIDYTKRNADGILYSENLSPAVDPYQFLASINGLAAKDLILDVLSTYSFNLEPSEIVQLVFDTDQISSWDIRTVKEYKKPVIDINVKKKSNVVPVVIVATAVAAAAVVFFYPTTVKP